MLRPSWTLGAVGTCPRGVIPAHSAAPAGGPASHPSSHFGIWSPLRPSVLPSYKFPDSFEINTALNQHIGCHCTHFIICFNYVTQSSKTPAVLHNHRPMCVLYNQLEFHFAIVTPVIRPKLSVYTPQPHTTKTTAKNHNHKMNRVLSVFFLSLMSDCLFQL